MLLFTLRCFLSCQTNQPANYLGRASRENRIWHLCVQDFIDAPLYKARPEYAWQSKYLKNMRAYPWTLFAAK